MPSTGIPEVDVNNPLYIEAEERGLNWLRKKYGWGSVLDRRSKRTHYDVQLHLGTSPVYNLDFKADGYFHETGKVGWEYKMRYVVGGEAAGWGMKDIHYILYVSPVTWEAILVDATIMRQLGEKAMSGPTPAGYKKWTKSNPGYGAVDGVAIPLTALEDAGAIVERVQL